MALPSLSCPKCLFHHVSLHPSDSLPFLLAHPTPLILRVGLSASISNLLLGACLSPPPFPSVIHSFLFSVGCWLFSLDKLLLCSLGWLQILSLKCWNHSVHYHWSVCLDILVSWHHAFHSLPPPFSPFCMAYCSLVSKHPSPCLCNSLCIRLFFLSDSDLPVSLHFSVFPCYLTSCDTLPPFLSTLSLLPSLSSPPAF